MHFKKCHQQAAFNGLHWAVSHSRPQSPRSFWPVAGSRALAAPDFLSMRRAFVSYSRPIRFDGKSVNRGLPVLDQARAFDPCHRPEGLWALGTTMGREYEMSLLFSCGLYSHYKSRSHHLWECCQGWFRIFDETTLNISRIQPLPLVSK